MKQGVLSFDKSQWKSCKLGELGYLSRGRSKHRPRYAFHLYGGKYPFIQTGEIREARKYVDKFENTYSDLGLAQSKLWAKNTLCITIAANIAELAILKFDACFPDSVLGFTADETKTTVDFIYYLLTYYQKELKYIGEGSVQDNINLGTFDDVKFLIPPLHEQKEIAEILSSLDDKIDLLHRQNKTLESMAQTLFRQWFIEEAQEEWEEVKLGDLMELKYGKDHKHLDEGTIPVYGSGGIMRYADTAIYEKESILIPRKGTLGNIFYVNEPFWTVDTIFWSKIDSTKVSVKFLFFFLKILDLSILNVGSAVPSLTVNVINEIAVSIPPLQKQEPFNLYINIAMEKINKNIKQIALLEKMRDDLLIRLMGGE